MKVLITGGAGFIGRRLASAVAKADKIHGHADGAARPDQIILFDNVAVGLPAGPGLDDPRLKAVTGDIADADLVASLVDRETGAIFHLSGIVSAGAEADFEAGYRVNLGGMQNLLAACRRAGHVPRLIFASSIAVYGGEAEIDDRTPLTPQTSYGTQKAICEFLINDATRKGHIDGRAVRLSAVVARPGKPNLAASTFASTIIREPLMGRIAACPVGADSRMPLISPGRVIAALLRLSALDANVLGANRAVLLGGLAPTVGEMVAALARIAGENVAARVHMQPDPMIQRIVDGWPQNLVAERAAFLGLGHDKTMEDVIQAFIDEELGGAFVA